MVQLNVDGAYSDEDILKLKRFALMLQFLRGTIFPYEFVVNARITFTADKLVFRQGSYPRNPLTDTQKDFLTDKIRQLFSVNFDKHILEIHGCDTLAVGVN